jgi:hypothetical protein
MSNRLVTNVAALTLGVVALNACSDTVGLATAVREAGARLTSSADGVNWSLPEDLGPGINAQGFDNRSPMISTNGKELFFGSDRPGGFGGLDIYVSHRQNPHEAWGPPQNLGPSINAGGADNNAFPMSNGHDLFFTSTRPGGCGGPDLYMSSRDDVHDDTAWNTPVNLGCTINSGATDSGPVYFVDSETGEAMIFFGSTRVGGQGSSDFYVSTLGDDGTWGPGVVIPELSSPLDDNKLSITEDGLTVFFSSNRPGGGQGAAGFNIWVATRATTHDPWSTPVVAVESAGLPSISTNGKTLYLITRQPGSGINGLPFKNDISVSTRLEIP